MSELTVDETARPSKARHVLSGLVLLKESPGRSSSFYAPLPFPRVAFADPHALPHDLLNPLPPVVTLSSMMLTAPGEYSVSVFVAGTTTRC